MRTQLLFALLLLGCGDSTGATGSGGDASGGAGPSSGTGASTSSGGLPLGEDVSGEYHLGPVEWQGSFNNACGPYVAETETVEGQLLAGLSNTYAADGSMCDACIEVTTALGHTVIARVITYGETTAPGNIDVSQAAYDQLNEGENPRSMTWKLVSCPDTGPLQLQYQTGANPYWTSLWVRNPRVAIDRVEVTSANHAQPFELRRGPDGTFNDDGGFGEGGFTLHVIGLDGSSWEQAFDGFTPGALVTADGNL